MEFFFGTVLVPLLVATIPVTIAYLLSRRGAKKKLDLDEQVAEATVFSVLSEAQRDMLDRGEQRITDLEKKVEALEKERDTQRDTISTLVKENGALGDQVFGLRALVLGYMERVKSAWDAGGTTMPALTPAEQELLEMTEPVRPARLRRATT